MEWQRYYQETDVVSFNEQRLAYQYIIEDFVPYLTAEIGHDTPIAIALGGLHPKVTFPEHFLSFCNDLLDHPHIPLIIDQNQEALKNPNNLPFIPVHSSLEQLPVDLPPISLLILDFTTDFMSDRQIAELNKTLPSHLAPNSLVVIAQESPFIPLMSKVKSMILHGLPVYPRSPKSLSQLLTNFKNIYQASTDTGYISLFSSPKSPFPRHLGLPYGINLDQPQYYHWVSAKQKTRQKPGL